MSGTGETDHVFNVAPYVVAVVDILGQGSQLARWGKPPPRRTPETLDAIKKSVGTVLGFAKLFDAFRTGLDEVRLQSTSLFPASMKRLVEGSLRPPVLSQQFGDTFVFFSCLDVEATTRTPCGIESIFGACCAAAVSGLSLGQPIRGGIAVGNGVLLPGGRFYGHPMAVAHHLESKVASWPRVLVDQSVLEFLQAEGWSGDTRLNAALRDQARHATRFLVEDDRCTFVDFAGEAARSLYPSSEAASNEFSGMIRHCNAQLRAVADASDAKLLDRYERLLAYLKANESRWSP